MMEGGKRWTRTSVPRSEIINELEYFRVEFKLFERCTVETVSFLSAQGRTYIRGMMTAQCI